MRRTGGCQCGKIRFTVAGDLGRASLCHCRMCQKAFGGPFGALVSAPAEKVAWPNGEPARFQSSNLVSRGYCAACGTPLTFEPGGSVIDLAIFAFDDPSDIVPAIQICLEARQPWIDHLADIPTLPLDKAPGLAARLAKVISNQHPDYDTFA
jgi:hypothetical protein